MGDKSPLLLRKVRECLLRRWPGFGWGGKSHGDVEGVRAAVRAETKLSKHSGGFSSIPPCHVATLQSCLLTASCSVLPCSPLSHVSIWKPCLPGFSCPPGKLPHWHARLGSNAATFVMFSTAWGRISTHSFSSTVSWTFVIPVLYFCVSMDMRRESVGSGCTSSLQASGMETCPLWCLMITEYD